MAGNHTNKQHTMLIQKLVEIPHFMNTANGGKKMAMLLVAIVRRKASKVEHTCVMPNASVSKFTYPR